MIFKAGLAALTSASHFRAGSFQFSQDADNLDKLILTRTMNYRRGFSGYDPACFKTHVAMAKKSKTMEYDHCIVSSSNSTCGIYESNYIVNDLENSGYVHSQWCYGYVDDKISKPTEAFEYYFQNCCWVDFTTDDGEIIADGKFKLYAKVNDVNNNSPQVKVPPIWRIMSGCPAQTLYLNPSDKDGDKIRCRWSTKDEAKSAYHENGNFNSLILDEEECFVTYDGTKDIITEGGVKPVAIHVEDFDDQGNVKSSIPVQFLATVWQPFETGQKVVVKNLLRHEELEAFERDPEGPEFYWPNVFEPKDGHDHHAALIDPRQRRKRDDDDQTRMPSINPINGLPYYCDEPPQLIDPSPAAGEEILVTGNIKIHLRAVYYENLKLKFDLRRFQLNTPQGMECTNLDRKTGRATCSWLPTEDQKKQTLHDFCFLAIDKFGRDTERRCITLKIIKARTDVHSLLDLIAPEFAYRATNNYGCAGRGSLNPFINNAGIPVDDIDRAISLWKKCIRCAMDDLTDGSSNDIPKYKFDEEGLQCVNEMGTIERSVCECDFQLSNRLVEHERPDPQYQQYASALCRTTHFRETPEGPACCASSEGWYSFYYTSLNCCEDGRIREIGTCVADEGRTYEETIPLSRPEFIHVGDLLGKPGGPSGNKNKGKGNGNGNGKGNGNAKPGNADKWAMETNGLEGNLG